LRAKHVGRDQDGVPQLVAPCAGGRVAGGIETEMVAYEMSFERSPLNISPGSVVERWRLVAA
jgi:hypothetical protein